MVSTKHQNADSTFKGEEASHDTTFVEAEVLDVKDDFQNVDLELAKDVQMA